MSYVEETHASETSHLLVTIFLENGLTMKQKILWISAGILLFIGVWFRSAFAEELRIGCVDIQRVVNECNSGKEATKEIINEVEKFQRLAAEKQKELQTLTNRTRC
jgi:Skp family chaperone for outer membrane proteins